MPRTRKTSTPDPTTTQPAPDANGGGQSLLDAWDSGLIQDTVDAPAETPAPAPVTAQDDDPIGPVATAPVDVPAPVQDLEPTSRKRSTPRTKPTQRRTQSRPASTQPRCTSAPDGARVTESSVLSRASASLTYRTAHLST